MIIVPRSRRCLHRLIKNKNTARFFLQVYAPNCSTAPFHGGHLRLHLHLYQHHTCATSSHICARADSAHMNMNASATTWSGQPSPTYSAYSSRTSSSNSYRSTPSSQTSVAAAADLSASSPLPLPVLRPQPRIQISSLLADPHSRSVTIPLFCFLRDTCRSITCTIVQVVPSGNRATATVHRGVRHVVSLARAYHAAHYRTAHSPRLVR